MIFNSEPCISRKGLGNNHGSGGWESQRKVATTPSRKGRFLGCFGQKVANEGNGLNLYLRKGFGKRVVPAKYAKHAKKRGSFGEQPRMARISRMKAA
jgi:hypothetical protein